MLRYQRSYGVLQCQEKFCINMISWSVPTRVDSHLQSRSRNGDGLNKAEGIVAGARMDVREGWIGLWRTPRLSTLCLDRGQDKRSRRQRDARSDGE